MWLNKLKQMLLKFTYNVIVKLKLRRKFILKYLYYEYILLYMYVNEILVILFIYFT